MGTVLVSNLVAIMGVLAVLWLISQKTRNVGIVDIFWGLGFVMVSWLTWWLTGPTASRQWLILATASLWGVRLAAYLAWRNYGKPEDYRYAAMRQAHSGHFPIWSLVSVFGLQGLLMWIVSWPLQWGQQSALPLNWVDAVGLSLWSLGWLCETIGDWQLARFKSRPGSAGRVMDRGLWRYTRHPNYFGDFLVWWGFYALSVAAGAAWWIVASPLIMSVLLMRVSGVTLLEKGLRSRRPEYVQYMQRTSAFFPWPPRRE